ncbi:MAG TPA: PspC domain-containing protein [Streptosporangiaceae bacterium]|jgi:phage shock protein C|nr:PspC domain-containing protein [Streptosporangiaceae bacterium]
MSTDSDTQQSSAPDAGERPRASGRPPLRRPVHGRMLAGVAAGLARYFGIDVTIVRIVLVVLAILGIVGNSLAIAGIPLYLAGIPLYLAGWLLIPEEGYDHSIAATILESLQGRTR